MSNSNCEINFPLVPQKSWKIRVVEPSPKDLRSTGFTKARQSGQVRSRSNLEMIWRRENKSLDGDRVWNPKEGKILGMRINFALHIFTSLAGLERENQRY